MKKAASLRFREYVRETQVEFLRRGNFVRIYPAKNSDIYDCYFSSVRPYNRMVYKALYTDEILRCAQPKPSNDLKLAIMT
mmetsp:Transcript_30116/g.29392  ORF Transcript_30116/g.29392 Transcript_30116/m.29392 type:complete len:80 (+) Transcript_30116:1851-2090(+)